MSTKDLLRVFIQTSNANLLIEQEQSARLKEQLAALEIEKKEAGPANDETGPTGGVKAWKIKVDSATPFYEGPHHEIEPYLTWYSKTVIFFATK